MEEQEQGRRDEPLEIPEQAEAEAVEHSGGDEVTFQDGFTMGIATEKDVAMNNAAAFGVAAGRDVNFTNGFGMSVQAGRDVSISDSFAVGVRSKGSVDIEDTFAMLSTGKEVNVKDSFIGILFSRHLSLDEDSRVMLGTRQAAVFGAAFGAVFALLGWLLRRRPRGR